MFPPRLVPDALSSKAPAEEARETTDPRRLPACPIIANGLLSCSKIEWGGDSKESCATGKGEAENGSGLNGDSVDCPIEAESFSAIGVLGDESEK